MPQGSTCFWLFLMAPLIVQTSFFNESEHALHHVWGYVGFVAETLIFMLAGMIIGATEYRLTYETKTVD
jgi:NhaP-type Na+/H+ or K+/H+ antiporter